MIKKSLLVLVTLIVGWTFFVHNRPFSVYQYQMQSNIIKAEKFIFDAKETQNVIVGSSLAGRLQMDSLIGYYNLSLSGQGVLDGLSILMSKKQLPSNVFIEMNLINRPYNQTFNEIITSPIQNTLKQNFLIFRTDKQPIALFESVIRSKLKSKLKQNVLKEKKNIENNPIFNKMLSQKIKTYSAEIDILKMDEQFDLLRDHVEFLISKNVNVFFFEMPVNFQLVGLRRAEYLRKRVKDDFADCKFIQLPGNTEFYKTTDGMHLNKEESAVYTSYFKKEFNLLENIN